MVISSFIFSLKRWTGSDKNPQHNDGEGPRGQDRNNVVLLDAPKVAKDDTDYSEYGDLTGSYPEHLDDATFLGLSRHDLVSLAYARGNYQSFLYFKATGTTFTDIVSIVFIGGDFEKVLVHLDCVIVNSNNQDTFKLIIKGKRQICKICKKSQ